MAVLARCLEGAGAVVAGAAGVGKTRLARAAAAQAVDRRVEQVVASRSAQALPLAPFARFRATAAGTATPGDDPLVALRQALTEPPGRLLLSVDDGHLLDDVSAALVHELCVSGAATVLVTLRSREPAPDAVTALWKDELCERIELQPLSRSDVGRLLEAALDAPVDNATVFALWERSRGNVLHLRELVRGGLAAGALTHSGSLWSWSGPLHASPRLVELLADRLATLDAAARRALALLALGEPLSWDDLGRLDAAATTEALVADGLVEFQEDPEDPVLGVAPRASLAHPLLGDVVLADLAAPARRRLLAELADGVDAEAEPLKAATWLLDSGGAPSPDLLVRASRACLFIDAALGERLAREALSRGAHDGSGAAPRTNIVEAAALVAQHGMISGRASEAEEVLAELDGGSLSLVERVQVAVSRANLLTWGLARPDDAVALLDRGGMISEAAGRELMAHAVPMFMFGGRVADAVRGYEALWADPAGSPVQRLRSALGAVPALVASGRPLRALAVAGEALTLVPECSNELPVALAQLGAGITLAQILSGDLDAAETLIRPAYEEGVARNIPLLRGGAALRLGQIALWRGQPVAASALVREAILALQQADAGLLAWASDTLRIACALTGDTAGVDEGARAGSVALRFPLFVTELHRADAAVAASAGELSRARQAARDGIASAEAGSQQIQVTILAFDLARYGGAAEAARRVSPDVEGPLAATMHEAIAALAASDGDRLLAASTAFAERRYELFAAEMARAAARAFGASGRRDAERRADAIADALADRCEGAHTPLLDDRPAGTRLTGREREVALLAARGASDAEIAQRLGLSVRTVETHLHRAYTKVGVTGRTGLAEVLGTAPTPPA